MLARENPFRSERVLRLGYRLEGLDWPGLLPALIECRTSPELLQSLTEELVPGFSVGREKFLRELYFRHGGNIRQILFALYDIWPEQDAYEVEIIDYH